MATYFRFLKGLNLSPSLFLLFLQPITVAQYRKIKLNALPTIEKVNKITRDFLTSFLKKTAFCPKKIKLISG